MYDEFSEQKQDLPSNNKEVQNLAKRYPVLMNRFYDCNLTILNSLETMNLLKSVKHFP